MDAEKCVGAIVCKLDLHKKMVRRGYIAMLAVDENYRRRGIGKGYFIKKREGQGRPLPLDQNVPPLMPNCTLFVPRVSGGPHSRATATHLNL